MTSPTVRATLVAITLIATASCSPPQSGTLSQTSDDAVTTRNGNTSVSSKDNTSIDSVNWKDRMIWEDREKDKRKVIATIKIPPGRDHVVIEREDGDTVEAEDRMKFLKVDSVSVLAPSKLRHIRVHPGGEGKLKAVLLMELARCDSLSVLVRDSVAGRPAVRYTLRQTHAFPPCCVPRSSEPEGTVAVGQSAAERGGHHF